MSAQTVRTRLREAHLHARHPHRGLDLTAVRRRNQLEWAKAHIRWRLALWRGVLFTDESRLSLSTQMSTLWIEWPMAVGLCMGRRMLWTMNTGAFIDGILNAQRYCDKILRPIVVPFIHDHHLILQHTPPLSVFLVLVETSRVTRVTLVL